MADPRYIVGIDLGTTNSALAYVDLQATGDLGRSIRDLPVPQLIAPGESAARRLLPSSAYLPAEHELAEGALQLPWGERPVIVGELAKVQGARVPGRLVGSAKSWLSHPGVDRTAAILPWGAPEGIARLSPVQASALYLSHLREAWDHQFPGAPLAEQEVVLTVPASFDEVARELTVRAAREAGLENLTLQEEPQAAFYDWTARNKENLGRALGDHRLILICDVGGGTTDLTLILVEPADGSPNLRRIAVGDHILLGGDNMDVALARSVERKLGARLDASQWSALVQTCRLTKERLLEPGGPDKASVAVAGRGSRLIAGAHSAEVAKDEVLSGILDGFFPRVLASEPLLRGGRAGLQELGLPFASDPAVTRQAASFLRAHSPETAELLGLPKGSLVRPDAILLNGGVFSAPQIGERLVEVLSGWFPGRGPIAVLENDALDLAVARGAAWFGLVRRGLGRRIGGGTARAYFVGADLEGQPRALCLLPRYFEQTTEVELPQPFHLLLDRPVRFPLYASSTVPIEKPGDILDAGDERLAALPPIQTVLRSPEPPKKGAPPAEVQVRLRAGLTEIGTLELWCVATERDARWKLEFQLRTSVEEEVPTSVSPMPKRFAEAKEKVELVFGKKPVPVEKRFVKDLGRELERILGPRETWTTPVCRELWSALHAGLARRRRTADHERVWSSLAGYCLRPGFGAPLDAWRAAETFKVFEQGLQFQSDAHNWDAWWILWRRISGGLDASAQKRLYDIATPALRPTPPGKARPKAAKVEGIAELIRMVGSLERLEAAAKAEAGCWLLERLETEGATAHVLWSIGRLGARVPFYGSGHACVAPNIAEEWIARLLRFEPPKPGLLFFPLIQLARLSGDRARDIDPELRQRVIERLEGWGALERDLSVLRQAVETSGAEEQQIFGETLPPGLRLVSPPPQ